MAGERARSAPPPARARSQRFLRSPTLAAELVRDSGVGADDLVVDLGAGTGRLTEPLARAARRVVAVELDPALARGLEGRWANVDVVEGDATAVPLPAEPFRVVANIPFDRTTDLLRHLLDDPSTPLVRADLVLEWNVAVKRALPWPSTALGAVWGAWWTFALVRRLPREAFVPRPAVAAGVLRVERRPAPLVPAERAADYARFVRRGFRRQSRARDLDAHAWARLFDGARLI